MTIVNQQLPRSPAAASIARRLVSAHSSALGVQQRDDAALLVSELVNNALLHGVGTISLRIDVETDGVRVEVSDQGNVGSNRTQRQGPTMGGASGSSRRSPMTGVCWRAVPGSGFASSTSPCSPDTSG
jgi:anti-sigma regulatory factor (Ser/Thr protein kinase)